MNINPTYQLPICQKCFCQNRGGGNSLKSCIPLGCALWNTSFNSLNSGNMTIFHSWTKWITNRIVWDILVTANHFLILSKGSGGLHLLTCCSSICQPALTRHECGGGGRDDRWGCLEQPRVGPLPMSSPRLLDSTPRLAACRKYACAVNSLSKEKHVLFIFCSINKTDKQAFASSAPKLKKAVHQNKNLGEYTK